MIGIGRKDTYGGDTPQPDPNTTRQLRELSERLRAVEGRLAGLRDDVDLVRHISEMSRSTLSMVSRRAGARGEPIRVLFLVHHPEAWYALADVYAAMAAADDFRPVVASLPRHFPGSAAHKDEDFVHERLMAFGVVPEHRRKGLDAVCYFEGYKAAMAAGFKTVEFSWILEDNLDLLKPIEVFEGRLYRRYRLVERTVPSGS